MLIGYIYRIKYEKWLPLLKPINTAIQITTILNRVWNRSSPVKDCGYRGDVRSKTVPEK